MANIDVVYPTKKSKPPVQTTVLLVNCMDNAVPNEPVMKGQLCLMFNYQERDV